MSEHTQWEHHVEEFGTFFRSPKREEIIAYLNRVGEDGWEAASLYSLQNSNKVWVTLKRPLTADALRRRRRSESWPMDIR